MKLLFDENLSPKLVQLLEDLFPNSTHVRHVGLKAADDPQVWDHAKSNGLMLVSKDSADVHATNLNGRTPLAETEFHKAKPVANLLRQHGANA